LEVLDLLARDQIKTFQELATKRSATFLRKDRPINLRGCLRKSAGHSATVHQLRRAKKKAFKKHSGGGRTRQADEERTTRVARLAANESDFPGH
jgi:hypothetical protein